MTTGTISSLGVGSGLELQSILEQLKEVDKQAITRKENDVAELEVQLNEFTVVNNKLLSMKSTALDLSLSSTFLTRTVTSSSESAFTATVADGTAAQSTGVTVGRIATKSTWLSAGKAAATSSVNTTLASQNFSYQVGGGDLVTVTVPVGTTLNGLVGLINNDTDNPGVTASLIDDGSGATPYKLVLKADETGSEQEITFTAELPDLDMTVQGQTGANLNAQVTVDGVSYQRQTNTITDVLSGITLKLQGAGSSTVSVVSNEGAVKEMIVELVTAYNDAAQELAANINYDSETEKFGILARTTLRDLPFDLRNLMTTSNRADSAGLVSSLFDLGLEFDANGVITLDEEVLAAAIADAPDSVAAFFLGDEDAEIAGFADTVNDYLREATSGIGQIAAEKTAAQSRIDDLELTIETQTERLDKRYDILAKQFIALDQYMSQMKSMGSYLTSQFDSLGSMLSKK